MRFTKTMQVTGRLQEIDLLWSVLGEGLATFPGGKLEITGSPMPSVDIVSDTTIRLSLSAGTAYLSRHGLTVKTRELTIADERLKPILSGESVDLFEMALGTFTVRIDGDRRPVFRRYPQSFSVSWPNGAAVVDIPWWPVDAMIDVLDVYYRRVEITTKGGSLITLEFV